MNTRFCSFPELTDTPSMTSVRAVAVICIASGRCCDLYCHQRPCTVHVPAEGHPRDSLDTCTVTE